MGYRITTKDKTYKRSNNKDSGSTGRTIQGKCWTPNESVRLLVLCIDSSDTRECNAAMTVAGIGGGA